MPEHTTFLHYLLARLPVLHDGLGSFGESWIGHHHLEYRGTEPIFMAILVMASIAYLAAEVRGTYRRLKISAVPEDKLTLRTFFEVFFGYFYDLAKSVMGEKNAKRYFPLIGSAAIFIFISNCLALVPGFAPPTSSLNVTFACALLVFISFNYYGLKENGWGYVKHLAGPSPYLAPLVLPIELISLCVRPVTLAVRLMLNMSVDHLLVAIFFGMFALFLPLPFYLLGIVVICVQTLVFCLLTAIYIGLATERHAAEH
ncbi:MAG: F0F1 ATP synthase subunit A [Deltaproteobacteria bacterium]|nr:F0F1 ATP synthase subunit A [Deltaproteobacteria bacterium]